jgi:charged multivesicular body protein 2A
MNLPALQRIAMEFERENDIMDQRQEMMDDAIDDVTGLEDEEEGEEVVNQVLDEIGIDLGQMVSFLSSRLSLTHVNEYSSARRPPVYRRLVCQKPVLLKQLEAV